MNLRISVGPGEVGKKFGKECRKKEIQSFCYMQDKNTLKTQIFGGLVIVSGIY